MSIGPEINADKFLCLFGSKAEELLCLAQYIKRAQANRACFSRPLLGDLLSEATKIEEILDAYGVRKNLCWYPFRQIIAAIKLFSNIAYIILHIRRFMPGYNLLPIDKDFAGATEYAFHFTCNIIGQLINRIIKESQTLKIPLPETELCGDNFKEEFPLGHLPADRTNRSISSPEETVVYLATAFLNLAEEGRFLHSFQNRQKEDYAGCIPDPISEEKLRDLEQKFHNLQSLYDTYISDSNVESLDQGLPVLRGHITVIFHLLETATALAHYCERHVLTSSPLIDYNSLLEILIEYSLAFTYKYLEKARSLCHSMLKHYAKKGRIVVCVPRYRGFHVRPSTLIARIVNHYGSRVRMKLEEETYDASITLDLFRANEKLNAQKRRFLAEEVEKMLTVASNCLKADILSAINRIIQSLYQQSKLVIYERNYLLQDIKPLEHETIHQCAIRTMTKLLSMGKIDIELDINVVFSGDTRVLADIKLLAEHGYGEDYFGNNLTLPEKLGYLRK